MPLHFRTGVSPLSADNLVEIDDVSFGYGPRLVLQGTTMRIPRGGIVAIMGGSGCGKTTLLRLVSGQLRPTEGAVRYALTFQDAAHLLAHTADDKQQVRIDFDFVVGKELQHGHQLPADIDGKAKCSLHSAAVT